MVFRYRVYQRMLSSYIVIRVAASACCFPISSLSIICEGGSLRSGDVQQALPYDCGIQYNLLCCGDVLSLTFSPLHHQDESIDNIQDGRLPDRLLLTLGHRVGKSYSVFSNLSIGKSMLRIEFASAVSILSIPQAWICVDVNVLALYLCKAMALARYAVKAFGLEV